MALDLHIQEIYLIKLKLQHLRFESEFTSFTHFASRLR